MINANGTKGGFLVVFDYCSGVLAAL